MFTRFVAEHVDILRWLFGTERKVQMRLLGIQLAFSTKEVTISLPSVVWLFCYCQNYIKATRFILLKVDEKIQRYEHKEPIIFCCRNLNARAFWGFGSTTECHYCQTENLTM